MDDAVKRRLVSAGIDVDEALDRFMGSEALMVKYLARFPQDPNFSLMEQAIRAGDAAQAFTAAHTLKGVTGNLSIHALYQPLSQAVEDLRRGDLAGAAGRMEELEALYRQVSDALEGLG